MSKNIKDEAINKQAKLYIFAGVNEAGKSTFYMNEISKKYLLWRKSRAFQLLRFKKLKIKL